MATLQLGSRSAAEASGAGTASLASRIRASRPVRVVLGVGVLVIVLIVIGMLALLLQLRAREVEDARRSLLNLNTLLAESTGRTLESVDLVLQSVLEELRAAKVETAAGLADLKDQRSFYESLKGRVAGLPHLDAISIVDTNGRLVTYSRGFPVKDIELTDREHFQRMQNRETEEPYVSAPIQNRATGAWTVYLARRILSQDGAMIGIAYGGMDLAAFERSYSRLSLGRGASVSLWRLDGTLLVRYPPSTVVGQRFEGPGFRGVERGSPPMVFETTSQIDGRRRIVARNVVESFPVATIMTHTRAGVLHQAREQTFVLALATVLLLASVLAVTIALVRQFWAYEAVAKAERARAVAVEGLGELEDQLRQSQKLEVIGQLTSGIAHDFNNTLTVVIGNLDRLIRKFGRDDPNLVRYVDGARSGADRAAALSRRLLAFSRRQPLEPVRLDVREVVLGLEDLLQQALGRRALLQFDLATGLPAVFVDRSGLESALLNLVVNARDAMAEGGTVTIATGRPHEGGTDRADSVRVTVSDTGSGMSPDVLRRAFEPFFTTKEAGVGTGLGLAQVADFVRQNGGSVAIETAIGQGCRVTFCLPPAPTLERTESKDPA